MWTKDKRIFIIDHGRMKVSKDIDSSLQKVLLKRLLNKRERDLFLEGYSKYRNPDRIIEIANKKNWMWIRKR